MKTIYVVRRDDYEYQMPIVAFATLAGAEAHVAARKSRFTWDVAAISALDFYEAGEHPVLVEQHHCSATLDKDGVVVASDYHISEEWRTPATADTVYRNGRTRNLEAIGPTKEAAWEALQEMIQAAQAKKGTLKAIEAGRK
jgi:hypothetical protein